MLIEQNLSKYNLIYLIYFFIFLKLSKKFNNKIKKLIIGME